MKKIKTLCRCRIEGKAYDKGKAVECSDTDARFMVVTGKAEYTDKGDKKAAETKGVDSKSGLS